MTEADAIDAVDDPVTVPSLVEQLRALGIEAGDTLLVHSSLSALGWVCGGSQAVVNALQRVLTEEGTLVMPTHSPQCSDPAGWENPPVPGAWHERIRETMPAYDPAVTPTRGMGAIPECFRHFPDVVRSTHPQVSFAAWGAGADAVVADHALADRLGERSPLARLYDHDADVLLLGVGHDRNTSLHLAEHRGTFPTERTTNGAPVVRDGERVWVEFEDIAEETADFPAVGEAFENREADAVTTGQVGAATARSMRQRALVDFAADWFTEHR